MSKPSKRKQSPTKPPRPLPTTEQAREGGIVAATNALDLLQGAKALAEKQLFGQAVSLSVLAFEEATKGRALLGLLAVARNPGSKYGFTNDQLRTLIYGPRHGFRQAAGLWQHMSPATLTALVTGVEPRTPEDKAVVDADFKAFEWLQRANALKEGGFYVDFHEGHWHFPRELKKDQWDEAFAVVEPFVNEAMRQATANLINMQQGKL